MQQHLRITEPGFDKLTGNIGNIYFIDGVSEHPLSPGDSSRICASMRATLVDGTNPSPAGVLTEGKDKGAPVLEDTGKIEANAQLDNDSEVITETEIKTETETVIELDSPVVEVTNTKSKFSRKQLEAIADEKGIAGLREIAEPMGIKSKAIGELISTILKRQKV